MKNYLSRLSPEFDYNALISQLGEYKNQRSKISSLIKKKEIIRVKKGLYVLGEDYQKPFSHEILANLIYGPSYISLEFALSHYGLIPERVNTITSITSKRNKIFKTSIGNFTYNYLPLKLYPVGLRRVEIEHKRAFIIASKEKSLADLLYRFRKLDSLDDLYEYLTYSLRIEQNYLNELDLTLISKISALTSNNNITLLKSLIKKIKS